MKTPNFFAETGLERTAERRIDSEWLQELLHASKTRFLPIWRNQNLLQKGSKNPIPVGLTFEEIKVVLKGGHSAVFLGLRDGLAFFALDISHLRDPYELPAIKKTGNFNDIREISLQIPRQDGGLLAYARAITHWHQTHKFCGRCGKECEAREGGHMRQCINPDCKTQHFPRTDPAVIMLVSNNDKIILARKKGWPEDRYSILAGFVEPGESLEGAVRREVLEEVGVHINNIRYHSSQPWPFPSNLMLGFFADAKNTDLKICDEELEDARWFSREELIEEAKLYEKKPHSVSIARRLIAEWALGYNH